MKDYIDRVIFGSAMMILSGIGILFVGAVPVVALFGGYKSGSLGSGLGDLGMTFILGFMMYAILFASFIVVWMS